MKLNAFKVSEIVAKKKALTIIAISVLGVLLITGAVFVINQSKSKNNIIKRTSFRSSIPTPPPYEEPNSALTYVPKDLSKVDIKNFITVSSLSSAPVVPVSCIGDTLENRDLVNLKNRVPSDPNIIKFIGIIENYEFSDEFNNYGKSTPENVGKRSKREISYTDVCKLNNVYYFLFDGMTPAIHRGGGSAPQSHFAYTDKNNNLVIIEDIDTIAAQIKLPPSENKEDYSIPQSTRWTAYFGCRQVYAANKTEVLIGCGGGDGPGSTTGISVVNLNTKRITEKTFCSFSSGVGKYKELCYNQNGQIYHRVLE